MHLRALLLCSTLAFPPLLYADWLEASSEHFVIYADVSERNLQRFAEKLERYHKAMSQLFPSTQVSPSPSNRPTIYVAGSDSKLRSLYGDAPNAASVGGFYIARAGNAVAYIPSIRGRHTGEASASEVVLMHEYAHHFMYENVSLAVPPWFKEGFAEYFSGASFEGEGNIILGLAPRFRGFELNGARNISIEELLDSATRSARLRPSQPDNFYLRSWTLFHYLYSSQEGKEKMVDYLNRLNRGEAELDAASAALGDLNELDRALDAYIRGRIPSWRVFGDQLAIAPVAVRQLDDAESAVMLARMRVERGDEAQAAAALEEARKVAQVHADSATVMAVLAQAEFAVEDDVAAIAAADQALAIDATHIDALIAKGVALTRLAINSKNSESWSKVRTHFISANSVEPDHPVPLLHFYLSYAAQGIAPTQNAIDGLEGALALAPYDRSLRLTTAQMYMDQKRFADAARTVSALAFDPHEHELRGVAAGMLNAARRMLGEAPAVGDAATPASETP